MQPWFGTSSDKPWNQKTMEPNFPSKIKPWNQKTPELVPRHDSEPAQTNRGTMVRIIFRMH